MRINANYAVEPPLTANSMVDKVIAPTFKGIAQPILECGFDTLIVSNKSKIERINLRKVADVIAKKIGLKKDVNVPETKEKLIAAAFDGLQNEKEFMADSLKSGYILPNIRNNATMINSLENKGILKEQMPWESPRFNNGILTEDGYKKVRQSIIDAPSWRMSEKEKIDALNDLARNNYRSGDVIQGNHLTFSGQADESANALDHADEDTHEGFWETLFNILDDVI